MPTPVVFCFDGSEGSRAAMAAAAELIVPPADVIVLTVWQTIGAQLARAGAFSGFDAGEDTDDARERDRARAAAQEGATAAGDRGYVARARTELADGPVSQRIIEVCDEVDARLIVCGRHGRGAISSTLLGSVSRDLITHAGRAVLIAPEPSVARA